MKKLSKPMEKVMKHLKGLKHSEDSYCTFYSREDGGCYDTSKSFGKQDDGTIITYQKSGTLRALEKRGIIEIIELGGGNADTIRIISDEWKNNNKKMSEEEGNIKVDIMLKSEFFKEGTLAHKHRDVYLIDCCIDVVLDYWNKPIRGGVQSITNCLTGEVLYKI